MSREFRRRTPCREQWLRRAVRRVHPQSRRRGRWRLSGGAGRSPTQRLHRQSGDRDRRRCARRLRRIRALQHVGAEQCAAWRRGLRRYGPDTARLGHDRGQLGRRRTQSRRRVLREHASLGNTGGNCTGSPPAFGAFNLDSANSCGFVSTPAAPNLPNTQPLLAPLADNGGPTKTLALLPGSPAIDFVTSEIRTNCQNMFDQRAIRGSTAHPERARPGRLPLRPRCLRGNRALRRQHAHGRRRRRPRG